MKDYILMTAFKLMLPRLVLILAGALGTVVVSTYADVHAAFCEAR